MGEIHPSLHDKLFEAICACLPLVYYPENTQDENIQQALRMAKKLVAAWVKEITEE